MKKKLILPLFSVGVFLMMVMVMEIASSFFARKLGSHIIPDYRLNHTWRPNSQEIHDDYIKDNPEWPDPYVHHFNRQGWPEKYDISKKKPDGVFRIFYVGDSFTEGTAPMDMSVPSLLEEYLNRVPGGEYRYEVVNTGTSSYSPTIYYILTRHRIMDYDPDLIVVNVDMTDNFDDWKYSKTLVLDAEGNPDAAPPRNIYSDEYMQTGDGLVKATWKTRLNVWMARNSFTYNLLRSMSSNKGADDAMLQASPDIYPQWSWCMPEWDTETEENVEHTLDMLRRLGKLCRDKDVRLVITSVPHYEQYAGSDDGSGAPAWTPRPHEAIAAMAKEEGIHYFSSYEALKPAITGTERSDYYYINDMHFNPNGYELWFNAHVNYLTDLDRGLLWKE